jgi:hypothetical protein
MDCFQESIHGNIHRNIYGSPIPLIHGNVFADPFPSNGSTCHNITYVICRIYLFDELSVLLPCPFHWSMVEYSSMVWISDSEEEQKCFKYKVVNVTFLLTVQPQYNRNL